MFCWRCISIHLCHKNQIDAIFILTLFRQLTSACFGHICSRSLGGTLYIYKILVWVVLISWLYVGQHIIRRCTVYIQQLVRVVLFSWLSIGRVEIELSQPKNTKRRLRLKCDGTCAETRFRLTAKRTSPFKSAGASVQSNTGSRGVRISGSNAGYTKFRGSVKGTGYPLHSPVSHSLPLSCVTVCHHISTGVYEFLCIYRVIQNDCRGFNNLSYTIHLRQEYMIFLI